MSSTPADVFCVIDPSTDTKERELLTASDVATRLGCSPFSVYRWISSGQLAAVRLGENGTYRVTEDALARFLRPAHTTDERSTT
jgi:excisionase family DNA binding protein